MSAGFSITWIISNVTYIELCQGVLGTEARLECVENRGEKMGVTSVQDSSTKPGFEGDERVGVEGGSGEVYIF